MSTTRAEFTAILDEDTQAIGPSGGGLILPPGRYPIYNADGDYAERMLTLCEPGGNGDPAYRVQYGYPGIMVESRCVGCSQEIFLYWALTRDREFGWRDGPFDETGRCMPAEERSQIVVAHQPASDLA